MNEWLDGEKREKERREARPGTLESCFLVGRPGGLFVHFPPLGLSVVSLCLTLLALRPHLVGLSPQSQSALLLRMLRMLRSASPSFSEITLPPMPQSLLIPANDASQRLEQAFQLMFQSSPLEYRQLCRTFEPLGGLPRAWIIKGESGAGKTYLANVLCQKYSVDDSITITIGELAIMYPGDMLKGLRAYLGSIKRHARVVGKYRLQGHPLFFRRVS